MNDAAASQILGFIVALAVVTGSLTLATYFIMTVPESGPDRQSTQLQGQTQRAIEILTTTPGQPADWHTIDDLSTDKLRRVGLLAQGTTHYASMDKIDHIQSGNLTSGRILTSWDINNSTHGLRVEGRVQSVGVGDHPGLPSFGVVHATPSSGDLQWDVDATSKEAAKLYGSVNPAYEYKENLWQYGWDIHPATGLGNTVFDHAYFIETQLIPDMAGIEATYSTADGLTEDWHAPAQREEMFDNYEDDTNKKATRWHVIADGDPHSVPGNPGESIDEHVMTVSFRKETGGDSEGLGLWRSEDGSRSTALVGGWDASGAESAELEFYHQLKVQTDDTDDCDDLLSLSCVLVRPSIMFWNTTGTDHWSRIREDPQGCGPSGWNDTAHAEETSNWDNETVDLCEAVTHSGDRLWLSFFWDTTCVDSLGGNTSCGDTGNQATRGWFIDNVNVSIDGHQVYSNDFEPAADERDRGFLSEEQLIVSDGVDHNRTYAPAHEENEPNTMVYIRNAVQNKTSVVALAPAERTGEWLSTVGLSTVDSVDTSDEVETKEPESPVMRYPNELPKSSDDYYQWGISWAQGDPPTTNSWDLPNGFEHLTTIQGGADQDTTLLTGMPYEGGGRVGALTYNFSDFEDEELRADLYENLYASTVFQDPTFNTTEPVPKAGTSEVTSDRRVMLVKVTPDDRYVVPIEITLWMWRE